MIISISDKEVITRLIERSFKQFDGFFFTHHAKKRMIERNITCADIENAYFTGEISEVISKSESEIKVLWQGYDCERELINMVLVYLISNKTLVITATGV